MNKDLILREKLALQRTILANQTTFLAFMRTAMYFLVAGVTINNFFNFQYRIWVEIFFFTLSGILFLIGLLNYRVHRKRIIQSEKHIGDYKEEYLMKG